MEMTRSFLALTLPPPAIAGVAATIDALREQIGSGDVKWVVPENVHITLRFFGDLAPDRLAQVSALAQSFDATFDAFPTAWRTLGVFPSASRVQVIWLGLADDDGRLETFAREVDSRLRAAGFGAADKPFRAHATLGRVRRGRRVRWTDLADGLTTPAEAFSIRAAVLFKSTLTGTGPIYTPLVTAAARG